jgi:hypothetical protein
MNIFAITGVGIMAGRMMKNRDGECGKTIIIKLIA